jgi:phospholipid/cholesterol/gamma-HCH transport system ATP-binding protein
MITLSGVKKSFGAKTVLDGVDFEARPGEVAFVIGPSGMGKSVLARCAVGLLSADAGSVRIDGREITGLTGRALLRARRGCAMVLQGSALVDDYTLGENVAMAVRARGEASRPRALREARERLGAMGLGAEGERMPNEVGPGTAMRAALVRALALEPRVVVYDEPTSGLDLPSARRVDALIRELCDRQGVGALVISHDPGSFLSIADRIAFLYGGRIQIDAPPAEIRASDDPRLQQFLAGAAEGPLADW